MAEGTQTAPGAPNTTFDVIYHFDSVAQQGTGGSALERVSASNAQAVAERVRELLTQASFIVEDAHHTGSLIVIQSANVNYVEVRQRSAGGGRWCVP